MKYKVVQATPSVVEVNAICNSVLSYHEQRDDNVDVDGASE